MRERLQAQAALAVAGGAVRLPRHARLAQRRGSRPSRWRSSASPCSSPASSARCWRAPRRRCCSRSSCRCRCRARRRRSPIGSPAGAWPRRRRCSRSRCSGRRRRATRCAAPAVAACRALAARLRADVAYVLEGEAGAVAAPSTTQRRRRCDAAVAALHRTFLATPYRPTGLSTAGAGRRAARRRAQLAERDRRPVRRRTPGAMARRPSGLRRQGRARPRCSSAAPSCSTSRRRPRRSCDAALDRAARGAHRDGARRHRRAAVAGPRRAPERPTSAVTSSSPRSTRASARRSSSFAVSLIAAQHRPERPPPSGAAGCERAARPPADGPARARSSAAQERAAAHVERNSVWLHNSVRGAVGARRSPCSSPT